MRARRLGAISALPGHRPRRPGPLQQRHAVSRRKSCLALSIVAQESPALADLVARYLVIGDRPSQAIFAVPSHLARPTPR